MDSCRRRPGVWLAFLLQALCLFLLLWPRGAQAAASDDAAALATLKAEMEGDYADAAFGPAQVKIQSTLDHCKKCKPATKAQLYIALGMIASQIGKADDARNDFATALGADPAAKLPEHGATPNIKNQWNDANALVNATAPASEKPKDAAEEASPAPAAAPPPAKTPAAAATPPATPAAAGAPPPAATPPAPDATPAPAASPPQENAEVTQEHKPLGPESTAARKIPGWDSVDAFQLASAGLAADMAGKLDECIEDDTKSLELEEQPRTRLHLSSCERRSAKLIDALRDAEKALEAGIAKKDIAVMKAARTRVQDLLQRIPHVTFQVPGGATDLHVTFDERDVPSDAYSKKFSVDPGTHKVHAEGSLNGGVPLAFEQDYEVKEGELLTVKVALSSPPSEYLTPGQLRCMLGAKTQDEVIKCLPQNRKNLVIKAGMELAGYADTTAVYVVTPSINGSISSPTAGWNIGGTLVVDVVSAASPDIVSEASLAYHEQRYAGVLTGGYKPGLYGVQVTGTVSDEPDYLSLSGGIALTADLNDKLTTPRVAASHVHDIIGRGPNNPISTLETTEIEAGVTMVLNPTTLLVVGGTAQFERGDQSKPYRYIPMFDPTNVVPFIPPGASIDLVNEYRLNVRPLEQLPTARDRYAFGARMNHRFTSTTLRLDERIYYDTWQLKASTTDARYLIDVSKHLRIWPHGRLNAQTGASFYQLAYGALVNPQSGLVTVPLYRTDDRELSPLITLTGGGGARLALGALEAKTQWGLTLQGDVMYTKYFDALYITFRTAVYGSLGLDAEFE